MSAVSDALIDAYRATNFYVTDPERFVLKIGEESLALTHLLARWNVLSWAFITADNPRSEPTSESENALRFLSLKKAVDNLGFTSFEGFGQDPEAQWPAERSLLVLGINRKQACDIGKHFDQNAIVYGNHSTPELVVLR